MPRKVELKHVISETDELRSGSVIKIGRWLKNLIHIYISVPNFETKRLELWHFDSQHGDWEFRDEKNNLMIDNTFESVQLDEFFKSRPNYGVESVHIVEGKSITFNFSDNSSMRTFLKDISDSSDKYNLWLLEMPNQEALVMDSNFDFHIYSPEEYANCY